MWATSPTASTKPQGASSPSSRWWPPTKIAASAKPRGLPTTPRCPANRRGCSRPRRWRGTGTEERLRRSLRVWLRQTRAAGCGLRAVGCGLESVIVRLSVLDKKESVASRPSSTGDSGPGKGHGPRVGPRQTRRTHCPRPVARGPQPPGAFGDRLSPPPRQNPLRPAAPVDPSCILQPVCRCASVRTGWRGGNGRVRVGRS